MDAATLYRQHLIEIGQIAESTCRWNGVRDHDAEDFASDVHLRLCEDDYAVLRQFRGTSSVRTYLTVVIGRLFLDYRIRIWGKWRASAQARRLGDAAVLLETLIYRDGCTFDAACQIIEQRRGLNVQRGELRTILTQLPRRPPRKFEGDADLDVVPAVERADGLVLESERVEHVALAEAAVARAVEELPVEDRLIIRMVYYEALSVAEIARVLGLEQKRLYPRIQQLLRSLRNTLKSQGITADFVDNVDSS